MRKLEPIEDSTGMPEPLVCRHPLSIKLKASTTKDTKFHEGNRPDKNSFVILRGRRILFPSLLCNPFVGAGLEQIERQRASVEHLVVEFA